MHLSPLSIAFTFILYPVVLLSWAIPFDDESGILYRFSPVSENEIEQLISWAGLREWDIWQTTRSHVDVYFPHRVIAETELGHLPFRLPPGTGHRIERWNHDASSYTHAHAPSAPATAPDVPVTGATDNDGEIRRHWDVASPTNATFHGQYHPLEEIESFVSDLVAAHPRQVSVVRLGHSGEGREMFALEISSDPLGGGGGGHVSHDSNSQAVLSKKGKPPGADPRCGFLITGAQHAREWVASASALYIAHALLADPPEQFSLAHLLKRHNFYIVPVPNPDGYVYTWEHDRFWYKNRLQHGPEARCVGVDMNRNWGYKWKPWKPNKPDSNNPCTDWYPGDRPFQAPEVNNMENYFSRLPRLKGFLDLRSYGQMLSTPFSYSCRRSPKDAEDQMEAISGAAYAMKRSHGMHFTTGALCSTLYRAPGNIVDWVYKKMGVKYSFAAHLRDTGTYGFALPEQWIRPVGEETAKMIEYLANFIADKECH